MSTTATVPLEPPPNREQLARVTQAVADFTRDELIWTSGYLAGLAVTRGGVIVPAVAPADAAKNARTLLICYGSQTGNAKRVAEALDRQVTAAGITGRLVSLADYPPRQLKQETAVLFVVSTQGDGDPPEDAVSFFEFLQAANAPRLEKLKFGVLALGDSSYPYFCRTGQLLDERLIELGATRLLARVDCDLDFAAPAAAWNEEALKRAGEQLRTQAPPRIVVVESAPKATTLEIEHPTLSAELLLNQKITGRASSKDVRHLEFGIDGGALPYQPGDGLAVLPLNPSPLVDTVLALLGATGDETVNGPRGPRGMCETLLEDVELTLLNRQFLTAFQARANHPRLAEVLAPDQGDKFAAYLESNQVVDVLKLAPTILTLDEFIRLLRPLARRTYSIASSLLANPDEAHLLVAIVRDAHAGEIRYGAASNFLGDLAAGANVSLRLEANLNFHLPVDDNAPVIMIGPGTGVAPFRGFVAERAARGARGRNWLLFGERTQHEDFLYQLEWQKQLASGLLHRLDVAFSRDQTAKIYVQDRVREAARDLYAWLEDGAFLYVCGDAKHMAKDVHAALTAAIREAGGMADEQARDYVQTLQRAGRYRRDVY